MRSASTEKRLPRSAAGCMSSPSDDGNPLPFLRQSGGPESFRASALFWRLPAIFIRPHRSGTPERRFPEWRGVRLLLLLWGDSGADFGPEGRGREVVPVDEVRSGEGGRPGVADMDGVRNLRRMEVYPVTVDGGCGGVEEGQSRSGQFEAADGVAFSGFQSFGVGEGDLSAALFPLGTPEQRAQKAAGRIRNRGSTPSGTNGVRCRPCGAGGHPANRPGRGSRPYPCGLSRRATDAGCRGTHGHDGRLRLDSCT